MPDSVRNSFPIPEQCDCCASLEVAFVGNEAVYGRPYGEWPYVYYCANCGAAVGCHPGTHLPLGRMADKKTRQMRAQVHHEFDPLWKGGAMTRTDAYKLLARELNIPHEECHISQLNIQQLFDAMHFCKELLISGNLPVLQRRKEKKDAKKLDRIEREKRTSQRFGKYSKRNSSARRARRRGDDSEADS